MSVHRCQEGDSDHWGCERSERTSMFQQPSFFSKWQTQIQFLLQSCMLELCFPAVLQSDVGSNWSSAQGYEQGCHVHGDRCIYPWSHLTRSVLCFGYCFGLMITPGSIILLLSSSLLGIPVTPQWCLKVAIVELLQCVSRPVLRALHRSSFYLCHKREAGATLSPFKEIRWLKNKG